MKVKELKAKVFRNGSSPVIVVPKSMNIGIGEYVKIEIDEKTEFMKVSKYEN